MKDHSSTSPPGDPIVIRLTLHIHDLSAKTSRAPRAGARGGPLPADARRPSRETGAPRPESTPSLEGALDRRRLRELVKGEPSSSKPGAREPDIELTLVLCV